MENENYTQEPFGKISEKIGNIIKQLFKILLKDREEASLKIRELIKKLSIEINVDAKKLFEERPDIFNKIFERIKPFPWRLTELNKELFEFCLVAGEDRKREEELYKSLKVKEKLPFHTVNELKKNIPLSPLELEKLIENKEVEIEGIIHETLTEMKNELYKLSELSYIYLHTFEDILRSLSKNEDEEEIIEKGIKNLKREISEHFSSFIFWSPLLIYKKKIRQKFSNFLKRRKKQLRIIDKNYDERISTNSSSSVKSKLSSKRSKKSSSRSSSTTQSSTKLAFTLSFYEDIFGEITVKRAASKYGIPEKTLYRKIKEGKLYVIDLKNSDEYRRVFDQIAEIFGENYTFNKPRFFIRESSLQDLIHQRKDGWYKKNSEKYKKWVDLIMKFKKVKKSTAVWWLFKLKNKLNLPGSYFRNEEPSEEKLQELFKKYETLRYKKDVQNKP